MQHLKHCIVLSFFGSTHKLASLYWVKPGYVYTYLCTGVLSHTHYKLDTTYLHTSTQILAKEQHSQVWHLKVCPWSIWEYLLCEEQFPPTQIICRLTCKCYNWNTRTVSKGPKVLFKAQHMSKSQQIYMFAKMMNFLGEWTGRRGNKGEKLHTSFYLNPYKPCYMFSVEHGFELSGNHVLQLSVTNCCLDPNIWVMQRTGQCHISATFSCVLHASTHAFKWMLLQN